MLLDAGALVHGRYEVLRPLGKGGQSTVYLARDRLRGTEGALKVFIEVAIGIKADVRMRTPQQFPLPDMSLCPLGSGSRLGDDWHLGAGFKAAKPRLSIFLKLDDPNAVTDLIPQSEGRRKLEEILQLALPFYIEQCDLTIEPDIETIMFKTAESYLGLSTVLSND